jgi:hypothetical protein
MDSVNDNILKPCKILYFNNDGKIVYGYCKILRCLASNLIQDFMDRSYMVSYSI